MGFCHGRTWRYGIISILRIVNLFLTGMVFRMKLGNYMKIIHNSIGGGGDLEMDGIFGADSGNIFLLILVSSDKSMWE